MSTADNHLDIFERAARREVALSRVLVAFIVTGLAFMLIPGTFLGVWNLISISASQSPEAVSGPWIQAHGRAQFFGWIATFIMGIGFYSIPKMRAARAPFGLPASWVTWALWTTGVFLRWASTVYLWKWRIALPVSAALELLAFLIFFRAVSRHEHNDGRSLDTWIKIVAGATTGLLATLVLNLGAAIYVVRTTAEPALPHALNQRFLLLAGWGFIVPFVWGFSMKWLPVFLGLRPTRNREVWLAFALNTAGVLAGLAGLFSVATLLIAMASVLIARALRLFEATAQKPKTNGVHPSFPYFTRLAYLWLVVAAVIGVFAAWAEHSAGIWGASRHALTVGFISTMVFTVGQRVLPAFAGMKMLYSPRLMFAGLLLLNLGCTLRVSSEILAYQGVLAGAWRWLPVSAVIEMTAISLFALNLVMSFARGTSALERQQACWAGAKGTL